MGFKEKFAKFMLYFGLSMSVIYIVLGICLFVLPYFNYISKEMRIGFGIFFIAYGVFRFARGYSRVKKISGNEDDNKA